MTNCKKASDCLNSFLNYLPKSQLDQRIASITYHRAAFKHYALGDLRALLVEYRATLKHLEWGFLIDLLMVAAAWFSNFGATLLRWVRLALTEYFSDGETIPLKTYHWLYQNSGLIVWGLLVCLSLLYLEYQASKIGKIQRKCLLLNEMIAEAETFEEDGK